MKAKVIISAFTGTLFALITYFLLRAFKIPDALALCVISGSLFFIMLYVFLLANEKRIIIKYAEFEKAITSPVFHKTNGNFKLGNGKVKNGNVYFCEAGIVCICFDEKPYTLKEIPLQNIARYKADNLHFYIVTKDEELFAITIPDTKAVIERLQEKGWPDR